VPWPLRATDLDVMGHVNNAAYWCAVEHCVHEGEPDLGRSVRALLDYRHPIDLDERVELVEARLDGRLELAFAVGEQIRAVARVEPI
jgi:acyl-ACP thioesterase